MYALRGVELTGTNTPRPFPHTHILFFYLIYGVHRVFLNWISGGHSGRVTPGSMPNPAVKPSNADGTAEGIRGRVGHCQESFFHALTPECATPHRPLRQGKTIHPIPEYNTTYTTYTTYNTTTPRDRPLTRTTTDTPKTPQNKYSETNTPKQILRKVHTPKNKPILNTPSPEPDNHRNPNKPQYIRK